MALLRPAIFPLPKLTPLPPSKMAARAANSTPPDRRRLPIVLFDVMDTIARDPFYHDVPAFSGKCKPSAEVYKEVVRQLEAEASNGIFVDDRALNVEAAVNAGMAGIHFRSADALEIDLRALGLG